MYSRLKIAKLLYRKKCTFKKIFGSTSLGQSGMKPLKTVSKTIGIRNSNTLIAGQHANEMVEIFRSKQF